MKVNQNFTNWERIFSTALKVNPDPDPETLIFDDILDITNFDLLHY